MSGLSNQSSLSPTRNTSRTNVSLNSRKIVKLSNASKLSNMKKKDRLQNSTNVRKRVLTESTKNLGAMGIINNEEKQKKPLKKKAQEKRFVGEPSSASVMRDRQNSSAKAKFYNSPVYRQLLNRMEGDGSKATATATVIDSLSGLADTLGGLFGKTPSVPTPTTTGGTGTTTTGVTPPAKDKTPMYIAIGVIAVIIMTILIIVLKKK